MPWAAALGCCALGACGPSIDLLATARPTSIESVLPADRRVDWVGLAGVPGGVPERTRICAEVTSPPYNAVGDGVADDTAAVQAALDACQGPDEVVLLPAGTYRLTAGLVLSHDGVTLRGAGAERTTLVLQGGDNVVGEYPASFEVIGWPAGYEAGRRTITLERTDSLEVGQELVLDQLNDPALVLADAVPRPQHCGRDGVAPEGGNARAQLQLVRITSLSGNQVGIEPPLFWHFKPELTPQAFAWSTAGRRGNRRRIGIERLRVDGAAATRMRNNHLLQFGFCTECWVREVEVVNIGRAAVSFFYSLRGEVRDSVFRDSLPPVGPERFGVRLDLTTGMLVENNVFRRVVSPVIFACPNSGDVVAYNAADGLTGAEPYLGSFIATYSAHNAFHLFEGNWGPSIELATEAGSGSQLTLFRNQLTGYEPGKTQWLQPVVVGAWNRQSNSLGNLLGSAGQQQVYQRTPLDSPDGWPIYSVGFFTRDLSDTSRGDSLTVDSFFRHGDFDAVTASVQWAPGVAPSLPASLYLSQRPAWWSTGSWPPFGPETATHPGESPAQARARVIQP